MELTTKQKDFFDAFQPKQAFWLGVITAILAIGTLGFIILGTCVLKGQCAVNGIAVNTQEEDTTVVADETNDTDTAGTMVPVVTSADHIRGDANAPITIIEYSDFQCSYCSRFHEQTMIPLMEKYDGDVRWVYRHFPLSFHPESNASALAAECAAEQGKFWEYADKLFENQADLSTDLYKSIATQLGLNVSDWQKCVDDERYTDKISSDATNGAKAGITGTPGSFVIDQDGNATPIKGALPLEAIAAGLDAMLQ